MGLSDKTTDKLREESVALGGRVYEDGEDSHEEDVTHFEEDDNPLTLAGDFDDDEKEEEAK